MSSPAVVSERLIRPRKGISPIDFPEIWRYRELFWFLAWRDVLVRYKQTYLGVAWAVIQPLLTALVFSLIFGRAGAGKFPTNGAPYMVLTFAALVPWQFFSNALGDSSNSLVTSAHMISKVYFPRVIVPSSAVLGGSIDFLIGMVLLFALMIWYHVPFTLTLLLLPFFVAVAIAAAFSAGIWLSALNVKYRDVKYIVPFFTRVGLYVSPVGFLSSIVQGKWRFLYHLNPMVGVIDGFR
ncbi:MAG TPA: ABC transporter permease, partial [Chthoniobacteraceae bacterium]